MANLQDMSNEELVWGNWYANEALREELLRRLATPRTCALTKEPSDVPCDGAITLVPLCETHRLFAGNSQAEKVQMTQDEMDRDEPSELCDNNATRIWSEPERSDGRITEQKMLGLDMTVDEYIGQLVASGEQRETRIQGEEWRHTPGLARGLTVPEAQRSAGRVEAGREQVQKVAVLGRLAGSVAHNQRNYKP